MESQMVQNCSIWNVTWPQLCSTDMGNASKSESNQGNTQLGLISIVGVPIVFLVVFVIVKWRRNISKHTARQQPNAAYFLANETLNQGKQQINNAETYSSTSFPQKKKLNSIVQNMDIVTIEENLRKPKYYANSNGRTIDRATQTRCSLVYKSSIFAKPWDKKCTIKRQGGIWEHRDSDVKVHFQNNSFHHKWESIEIHGSTFGDIADIRRKFNIDEERHIIAPVVEFTLTITEKLSKYAEVEIPHSMTTNYENIRVQWFASNPYGTIELRDVPHKKEDGVHDVMYEVTKDRVKVFTTHFSGFVCTVCGKKRDISICATVFGSYLFIKNSEWNVNIRTYLSDQNARIKEFQREMHENENRRKMTQLDQKPLLFEGKLSTDTKLSLAFDIHEDDEENWQHVTKPKTRDKLLHPITQTIPVGEISKCCQRGGVNKVLMDWCLKNVGNSQPDRTFRCFLEIKTSNLKYGIESEEINLQLFLDRTQKGEESLMHETLGSTDPVEKITLCLANELTRSQCIELCREMGSTTLEIDKCNTGYNDVPKEFCYQLLHGCLFKRVKPDQLFGVIEKALPKIGEEVILRKIRDDLRRIQYSAVQEETDYFRRPLVNAVQVTEQAEEVPHEVQCTTDCEETDVKMCSRVEYV